MERHTRALLVFARVPQLGRVKTRLAAEMGTHVALSAYRHLAEHVLGAVRSDGRYSVTIAYAPRDAEPEMREWLGRSVSLTAQTEGDLGDRMRHAIADAFSDGAQRVVVIGTDCPYLTVATVEDAFARLSHADIVLGPAADGGYYLIGMSTLHPSVFTGVPWSSADTFRVTLERARSVGLSVAVLEELRDTDTADDWREWLASSAHHFGGST